VERRRLGRTGVEVGAVGLGTEYLHGPSRETVVSVVRGAVEHGIDYFDVLWSFAEYLDNLGAGLKGVRDEVTLALHLGCAETDGQYRLSHDVGEIAANFDDMLSRLRVGHADILMVQWVDDDEGYARVRGAGGVLELARRLREEGKGRFIGLSSHVAPIAAKAARSGEFDAIMFPINPAFDTLPTGTAFGDEEDGARASEGAVELNPERRRLYEVCAAENVGLVAMKPFAGGRFFQLSDEDRAGLTPVRLVSYALSQVGVSTVVPGVKSREELEELVRFPSARAEEKAFGAELAASAWSLKGGCVYCNHCLPCPVGIDVGGTLRLAAAAEQGVSEEVRREYDALPARASDCVECGECVERCPFGVDVMEAMRRAAQVLEG